MLINLTLNAIELFAFSKLVLYLLCVDQIKFNNKNRIENALYSLKLDVVQKQVVDQLTPNTNVVKIS
jgi:hypothetical protein